MTRGMICISESGKKISVIIVSYNSGDVIDNCLASVFRNNDIGGGLEIIVVEQSREDTLYRRLAETYPGITLIRAENRGFGAGNNRGAEAAKGEILFFLNPDTVLEESLFSFAAEKFDRYPRLGLMGVRVLSEKGNNISYNMLFPLGLASKLKFADRRKADRFDERQMYIEGADMIVRRDVFAQIGGFDEKIFMYGEETDLCLRIREAGYTVQYFGEKSLRHLQGKCTEDRYPAVYTRQLDSLIYVYRKHGFDDRKWLRREVRYQKCRGIAMRLVGKKKEAALSGELAGIAESRLQPV